MKVNILSIEKTAEKDDYEKGIVGNGTTTISENKLGTFESIQKALEHLSKMYDFPKDIGNYFAFEEGRISTNRMEDADGGEASKAEIEQWKAGKKDLYLADFDIWLEIIKESYAPSVDEMVKEFGVSRE